MLNVHELFRSNYVWKALETSKPVSPSPEMERADPFAVVKMTEVKEDKDFEKELEKKIKSVMIKKSIVLVHDFDLFVDQYTRKYLPAEVEKEVGEELQLKSLQPRKDLRRDFAEEMKKTLALELETIRRFSPKFR